MYGNKIYESDDKTEVQLTKKYRKVQKYLYDVFIDLGKAYSRAIRNTVCQALRNQGISGNCIRLNTHIYGAAEPQVENDVKISDSLKVTVVAHYNINIELFSLCRII